MYKSPIEIMQEHMQCQMDDGIYKAVLNYGINVDKEELLRALKYDRGQYEAGYRDGESETIKHGQWILGHVEPGYFTPGGNRPWVCSECGQVVSWRLDKPKENFCHNCGAKMNGGEENG